MFYTFFTKALAAYENIPLTPDYIRTSPSGDAPVIALLVVAIVCLSANQHTRDRANDRSISSYFRYWQHGSRPKSMGSDHLTRPGGSGDCLEKQAIWERTFPRELLFG